MAGVNKFLRIYYARVMELEQYIYIYYYIFSSNPQPVGLLSLPFFRD